MSGEGRATAINDRGQVLGLVQAPGGGAPRPFVWERGRMTHLGGVRATAINEHDQIVGTAGVGAVLWTRR